MTFLYLKSLSYSIVNFYLNNHHVAVGSLKTANIKTRENKLMTRLTFKQVHSSEKWQHHQRPVERVETVRIYFPLQLIY